MSCRWRFWNRHSSRYAVPVHNPAPKAFRITRHPGLSIPARFSSSSSTGTVAEAVAQITVAGNFYQLLKNIRAVGSDLLFAHPGMSCVGAPALYVGEISVAGK